MHLAQNLREMSSQTVTLRDLRKSRGLTLVQLARACGVSNGNLSRIERGREGVTVDRVCQIAKGLEIPAEQVFVAIVTAKQKAANDAAQQQAA